MAHFRCICVHIRVDLWLLNDCECLPTMSEGIVMAYDTPEFKLTNELTLGVNLLLTKLQSCQN